MPSTNKKKPTSKARSSKSLKIGTMKGGVVVQGGIKAKQVIAGDQTNYYDQRRIAIATPAQFIAEAERVNAQLAEIKQQPELSPAQARILELAEGDVTQVIEEAKKPQPLGERIRTTLDNAKATMESLNQGLSTAVDLGKTIAGVGLLADAALKVFGSIPH